MTVAEAQRELREVYWGGFSYMLVESLLWLGTAVLADFGNLRGAMFVLFFGGMLIHPCAQLLQRLLRRPRLSAENPLPALATETALIIPLSFPVILAAARHHVNWFLPAVMVIVGAHYLPFAFAYNMKIYLVIAGVFVLAGLGFARFRPNDFSSPGYFVAGTLLVFAFTNRWLVRNEMIGESARTATLRSR